MMTRIQLRLEFAQAKGALQALPLVLTLLFFVWFAYDRWLAVDAVLGLGIDAGNYLATMRQISGENVSGEGLLRPPIIGYFLWPLVQIFGPLAALKIGAVIVSVLHAGIFFALASRHVSRGVALTATLAFVFTFSTLGALSWGYFTLLAVAAYGLAFICLREALAGGEKRYFIGLALAAWLLVFSNQIGVLLFGISAFGAGLAIAASPSLRTRIPWLVLVAGAVGLSAVPLASIYFNQSGALGVENVLAFHVPWEGTPHFWRDFGSQLPAGALGRMAFAAAAVWGAIVLARRSKADLAATVTPALVLILLELILSGSIARRGSLFISIWTWLFVAVAAQEMVRRLIHSRSEITLHPALGLGRSIMTLAPVPALIFLLFASSIWTNNGLGRVDVAIRWFSYLSPERLEAIETIDKEVGPGPGVAYPLGLGWWIEGLTARQVFDSDSGAALVRDGRLSDTRLANVLLTGESVVSNRAIFASEAYSLPSVPMDPAVGLDNGEFKHFVYLDDDQTWVVLEATEGGRVVYFGNGISDRPGERLYDLGGVSLRKTTSLVPGEPTLRVTFSADGGSHSISSLTIPIMAAREPTLIFSDGVLAAFGFMVQGYFVEPWQAVIMINIEVPEGVEAIFEEDSANQRVVLHVEVDRSCGEPSEELISLVFSLVGPSVPLAGIEESYSAADSLRQLNPAFLLIDTAVPKGWLGQSIGLPKERWLAKSPWFRLAAHAGSVVGYAVDLDSLRWEQAVVE